MAATIHWKNHVSGVKPAGRFLALTFAPDRVQRLQKLLRHASLEPHRADDVLRAARVPPLHATDPRLAKLRGKLQNGKKLPPVLVVVTERGCVIANGDHRVSLAWHENPATPVPVAVAYDTQGAQHEQAE
ncbi:MAG: hypothetical protein ACYCQK_01720 [Acidiferrobacteraceae bacterium]